MNSSPVVYCGDDGARPFNVVVVVADVTVIEGVDGVRVWCGCSLWSVVASPRWAAPIESEKDSLATLLMLNVRASERFESESSR
jgi:hypothetical protein